MSNALKDLYLIKILLYLIIIITLNTTYLIKILYYNNVYSFNNFLFN